MRNRGGQFSTNILTTCNKLEFAFYLFTGLTLYTVRLCLLQRQDKNVSSFLYLPKNCPDHYLAFKRSLNAATWWTAHVCWPHLLHQSRKVNCDANLLLHINPPSYRLCHLCFLYWFLFSVLCFVVVVHRDLPQVEICQKLQAACLKPNSPLETRPKMYTICQRSCYVTLTGISSYIRRYLHLPQLSYESRLII